MPWTTGKFDFSQFSSRLPDVTVAQFAYNEMSFFIVRMLQTFDSVSLASDAQPESSKPSAAWANASGRQRIEKIRPKSHLTMYALVCSITAFST